MKTPFLKILFGCAVATMFLTACGDDGSDGLPSAPQSSAEGPVTTSSDSSVPSSSGDAPVSQATDPQSSSAVVAPESSAEVDVPPQGGGYTPGTLEEEIAKDAPFVEASAANGTLLPLAEVLAAVQPTERVVFVLRHARRGSSTGRETPLHMTGVNQCQTLGVMIAAVNATDPIFYAHSDFVRTESTAKNIFAGRGGDTTQFVSTVVQKLAGGGYVKNDSLLDLHAAEDFETNQLKVFASWMYKGEYTDTFNDLTETSVALLTQYILPAFPPEYRIGIMISHDMVVAPLTAYLTKQAVDFKAYEDLKKWLGYVQGVAIIIAADGSRRYIPVNGLYGQYADLDGVNKK